MSTTLTQNLSSEFLNFRIKELEAEVETHRNLAQARLETIRSMSSYLDDLAEALGIDKPSTPAEGVGAVWKVMESVQSLRGEVERLNKIKVAAKAIADNAGEIEFEDAMGFTASLDHLSELNGALDDAECDKLVAEGHTEHCAARHVWGDGECECQKKGVLPGPISQMVIEAAKPPILCLTCQQMKFTTCPYPYARESAVECNCFTQAEPDETCESCRKPLGDDAPPYEDADICRKCHNEIQVAEAVRG